MRYSQRSYWSWMVAVLAIVSLALAGCGSSNQEFVFTGNVSQILGLSVTPEAQTLAAGTSQQLTATASLSTGATQVVTEQVAWTSSNPEVATVSDTGLVRALTPGTATIQASIAGVTDSATIEVSNATLTGLAVTPSAPTVVLGNTQQLAANATFTDMTIQDVTTDAVWSSSDETLATVDQNGLVTSVAVGGPVTITATFGGQSANAQVTVSAQPLDPPVATSLRFVTPPANGLAGVALTPAVEVEILDQYGDRFSSNASLTLFFGNNPTGAGLTGQSVAAVDGLATFDTLAVDRPGTGFTLVATGAGLPPVSSDPFTINLLSERFDLFGASLALPIQPQPNQTGSSTARWTGTGDFNNDGRRDAVTVFGGTGLVRVHLRQDDGRFQANDLAVADASAVVVADFNGDGNDDLMVVRRSASTLSLFLGAGDGTFAAPTDSTAPANVNDLKVAEMSGDGFPDLVIASETPDRLQVFENTGVAPFFANAADATVALANDGEAVAVGDLDGGADGLDVVVGLAGGANDVVIQYDYDPVSNTFGSNAAIAAAGNIRALALGDVDGANGLDIVVGSSTGLDALLNDGLNPPSFTSAPKPNNLFPAPNMSVPTHPQAIAVGNLDADLAAEVVVADIAGTVQNLRVFFDYTSTDPPAIVNVPHTPQSVFLDDFNGDGVVDVSSVNRSGNGPSNLSSTSTLAILINDGQGRLGPVRLGAEVDTETTTRVNDRPALGDVNGDGFVDLVVASPAVDQIQIWLGDGSGEFDVVPNLTVSTIGGNAADEFETNPLGVALFDLDGDGDLDLVLADGASGEAGGRFFLNDGAATPTFTLDDANALAIDQPQQILTAQLDGDAELELVWRGGSLITVANGAYPFTGGSVTSFASASVTELAAGFLNGDAFADLVGTNGTGIVVFYNDATGGFEDPVFRVGPGAPPANISRVATGDLDGDGLWDVAASQANSNQIHLFFSLGTSFEDLSLTATGSEGPQGMAIGDVNGDGLNDLVIAGRLGANVGLYLGQGGRFLRSAGALLSGIVSHVALGDLNGDGLNDIVAGSSTGVGGLFPLLQQAVITP